MPIDRQLPDDLCSNIGQVNSSVTKCWLFTLGLTFNLSLGWKKADVFKINDDAADENDFIIVISWRFFMEEHVLTKKKKIIELTPVHTVQQDFQNGC